MKYFIYIFFLFITSMALYASSNNIIKRINIPSIVLATSYSPVHDFLNSQTPIKPKISNTSGIQLIIESKPFALIANKPITIRFQFLKGNKIVTEKDLKVVHTQRIHLLIIDPSLKDYHHIHPLKDNKKKDFVFSFIPKNNGSYRMWVDITPFSTNQQEFLIADLGLPSKNSYIDKKVNVNFIQGPYSFTLKLDGEPKVGQESMATIVVKKNGKPFTQLEPVMDSYAHLVGFSEDYFSVLHIHPMSSLSRNLAGHGGPELMFHMNFKKPGFFKLFAQFRINGKDIFIPFSIFVLPAILNS
ncbi:MAG: hypothetical protein JO131_10405 [Gammaproteobacteria bacterium]|nr:hypothetical protein [Gammaproteobacteria bacterium]